VRYGNWHLTEEILVHAQLLGNSSCSDGSFRPSATLRKTSISMIARRDPEWDDCVGYSVEGLYPTQKRAHILKMRKHHVKRSTSSSHKLE